MLLLFIFSAGYFLAFTLFFPSFSLPVFSPPLSRTVVFSMARAPWSSCGALPSLVALCLVSRRSFASPYSQCRCECELVCILSRVLHLVFQLFHCLSARSIEEQLSLRH